MPAGHLLTSLGAPLRPFFVQRLGFGLEIALRQTLEPAWCCLRALLSPPVGERLDVLGKGTLEVMRGIIFAHIGDTRIERHQCVPSMTKTTRVDGSWEAVKWVSRQFSCRSRTYASASSRSLR